jgi:holo-[acyl-carrier protein] synthase
MIRAVGVDVVSVERIIRAMRRVRFVERVLTPAERLACSGPEWLAGRWAAKEAVAKCWPERLNWHDVEVLPTAAGPPRATVKGQSIPGLHVSISHERETAVAFAVLEGPEG